MISISERTRGGLVVEASGRLSAEDYRSLVPRLEEEIQEQGKLRLLIRLREFKGWTPKALLDDLRFDIRHHGDFDRVAIVGEHAWEKLGTQVSAPFFSGSMRFFEDESEAQAWLG